MLVQRENKRGWFVFDLDDCIANTSVRMRKYGIYPNADLTHVNWEAFYEECDTDYPIKSTINIMNALHASGWNILILSCRSAAVSQKTSKWLHDNDVNFDKAILRNFKKDKPGEVKSAIWKINALDVFLQTNGLEKSDIIAIFDDRKENVDTFREFGYICMQNADNDY